ncbi:hypothetical protein NXW59_00005 [Bacteroides fragilis]|nr:hypothetical protein [Bacteroides fragilis]
MVSLSNVITDTNLLWLLTVYNGTQPKDYYWIYEGIWFGYNYNGNGGSSEARFYNPSLKWEKNYATNIGITDIIQ